MTKLVKAVGVGCLLFAAGCVTHSASHGTDEPAREALFEYPGFGEQATGVAVSGQGRIFLNFPRWDRDPTSSVAELLEDGSLKPYPDSEWNRWRTGAGIDPGTHFVCVQSVYVDDEDSLWVLDPASPSFAGVVGGGAKLVKIDLAADKVIRVIPFDEAAAPQKSYLNDVRVDNILNTAYITDSGSGAIVVVDLKNGKATRRLYDDPSTKAEPGYVPVIGGRKLLDGAGQPPAIHADGIALDSTGDYLYYHALTGTTLYRIRTEYLRDFSFNEVQLGSRVEKIAATGAVDGMLIDEDDNLYLASLEKGAIIRRGPDGLFKTVVEDERIRWPDSMSISPDKHLYFTAAQIHLSPRFNKGKDRRVLPYKLFKVWLEPL